MGADRDTAGEPPRWSIEQRLAFAANRLYWEGAIQREDIVRRFGVSPTQATADLARLRAALGEAIRYDVSRRAYVPTVHFSQPPTDAAALLEELRLIGEDCLPAEAGVLANPPPLAMAGVIARSVETEVLRAVLWAIREGSAIAADYVSFQRPEVVRRILSPHAFVFDGFRWHVRAHDAEDGRFKDFLLSRLSRPEPAGLARAARDDDHAWLTTVTFTIIPHPGLSAHQQAVVERDYGMTGGVLELKVREAVAFYARKRLGLVEGHHDRPAREQQIVLARK